jgi:DNA-binding MarR family transcriptional regulator
MTSGTELIPRFWAAINLETMVSRAWSDCFPKCPDVRFDEYRQIVLLVLSYNAKQPMACTPSNVHKVICDNCLLDHKTVRARIQRLVDEKLFVLQPHPIDGRKKLIRPTAKLLEGIDKYNSMVTKIAGKIHSRTFTLKIGNVPELEEHLHFDIWDHVESKPDDFGEMESSA